MQSGQTMEYDLTKEENRSIIDYACRQMAGRKLRAGRRMHGERAGAPGDGAFCAGYGWDILFGGSYSGGCIGVSWTGGTAGEEVCVFYKQFLPVSEGVHREAGQDGLPDYTAADYDFRRRDGAVSEMFLSREIHIPFGDTGVGRELPGAWHIFDFRYAGCGGGGV